MKKLALALVLSVLAGPALAGAHYFPAFVAPIHHHMPRVAPTPSVSEAQKWSCWMNPAAVLICIVTVAIVADEIRRSVEGPACASGRQDRRSYFGMVIDEPKLWRPLCNFRRS